MKFGLNNKIRIYKGRTLDLEKQVYIYRNLKGRDIKLYSIMQKGLVVAHTTQVMLHQAEFIIRKGGKEKALKTKQRNVHAFIKGFIAKRGAMGTDAEANDLPAKVSYNPFRDKNFIIDNFSKKHSIFGAMAVGINQQGVRAAYTY